MNNFYVYEWFNIDTGEVFYVGKGSGARYKNIKQRNKYFINYYNKYNCDVRKVKNHLTEDEAFAKEIELIQQYRKIGQCECNLSDGGEGATFPEGSWNDIFRKLQYLHDVKGAMDNMPNEEEYESSNLKNKTLYELKNLHKKYIDFKDGISACKILEINNDKLLSAFEYKIQNEEIVMLTRLLTENIAKQYVEFKDFLNWNNEVDFICVNFDSDKFLNILFENYDYYNELTTIVLNMLRLMKSLNNNPKIRTFIKLKSYYIKGNNIYVKCNTENEKKKHRIKVNLYDVVWGMLMFKDKLLINILYDEILASPITM